MYRSRYHSRIARAPLGRRLVAARLRPEYLAAVAARLQDEVFVASDVLERSLEGKLNFNPPNACHASLT